MLFYVLFLNLIPYSKKLLNGIIHYIRFAYSKIAEWMVVKIGFFYCLVHSFLAVVIFIGSLYLVNYKQPFLFRPKN